MSDTAIRIMAFVILVALLEFMACCWMYDQWKKQQKRADHWRAICKEQSANPLFEVNMVPGERMTRKKLEENARVMLGGKAKSDGS